jgi:hypothetical protein
MTSVLTRAQKRRLLAVIIGAAVIEANTPRQRAANKHRDRRQALLDIEALSASQFKKRFRMSKNSFAALLDIVREDLKVDEHMAAVSSGDPVFEYLQLAICIRYLAGVILLVFVLLVLTHTQVAATLTLLTFTRFTSQP